MFGNHATSVTHGQNKDLTNDFEYPEKGKKFVSVNWTTKEDNRDIVAGTLTIKQQVQKNTSRFANRSYVKVKFAGFLSPFLDVLIQFADS